MTVRQDINGGMSVNFVEGVYLMAAAMVIEAKRAAALGDREAAAFLEDWRQHFGRRRMIPQTRRPRFLGALEHD